MAKLNQSGLTPLIFIIIGAAVLALGGGFYYFSQKSKTEPTITTYVAPTSSPSPTPTISPTPTPSPTPKPTLKPTTKPTATPTPKPSASAAPQSGIHADPSNITLTKKKSELGDDIAELTLYYSGTHSVDVGPSDGTIGIYGLFKDNNSTFMEIHDSAKIEIGFASAFGHEIKTGENKVNLQIKEGSSLIDALNSSVILNIPVTITVTD